MDDTTSMPVPVSLPAICAPRENLMRIFDGAAEKQFIYAQAPGGYGKTVSAMLWLKKAGCRAAWHCFDEYDNTPAMFYRAFCLSLLSAVPQKKSISGIPRSSAFNGDPAALTIEFLTRADHGRKRVVMVMDDFHAVTNGAVQKSFQHVIKRLPENVTVFFLSRGEMPAHFDALKNNGQISLIGVREFAFSADEIQKYAACHRQFFTESQAEELRAYTDGRITLLSLIVAGSEFEGDVGKLKIKIKNFYQERWGGLDHAFQQFLLKTAVPDHFSLALSKALTGDENSEDYLNTLIMGNANLSFSNGEYHYHQIVLELLRKKLADSDIDVSAAYKMTVEYYLSENNVLAAYKYAIKSGDSAVFNKVLTRGAIQEDIYWDEFYKIINVDEISEDMCDKMPLLHLARLSVYLVGNQRDFERYMDGFYDRLPALALEYPEMYGLFANACLIDYRVSFSEFVTRMRAIHRAQIPAAVMPAGSAQMPFLHRDFRDYYELADAGLRIELEEFFRSLSEREYEHSHKSLFSGIEAGLYLERNRPREALDTLLRAERCDKTSASVGWAVRVMLAEASLYLNDGDAYERYKARAKAYFENRGAFCHQQNHLAYEARTKLWNGEPKAAEEWLDHSFAGAGHAEFDSLYKIYQNFTTVRAHIVLGETGKAIGALETIKAMSEAFVRPLDAAEADVLLALTAWGMGNKKEARERLCQLLATLYPRRFIRVIANEGRAILPVLQSVLKNLEREPEKDAAFYQYVREVYAAAYEWSRRFKGLIHGWERKPVKLSEKQALILTLLSKGLKNAQIVERTGLSINTIKSYTKIAYQKLEVNTAMDAIVKAKQLGILK